MARRAYAALALAVMAGAGCGGGERQDANEPEGTYKVDVVRASFPQRHKLAKTSTLAITVRNAGDRTIPNVAVTVRGFDVRKKQRGLADPTRPVFVVNGRPVEIGGFPESKDAAPSGCETAYVDTWACGTLRPGRERSFRWRVTALKAGRYTIRYVVAAGLDGKARAVSAGGGRAAGRFSGTVSDTPPNVRVADDGRTIVEGQR